MQDRFPRRVYLDSHYLIHKVAKVEVDDRGVLRFSYEDVNGNSQSGGPFYPSLVNGKVPLGVKELAKNGLEKPDEVHYVIAYHSGAFPNGLPVRLLRSLEEIPKIYRSHTPNEVASWVNEMGGELELEEEDPCRAVVLIDLTGRPISDDDLAKLKGLSRLRTLELGDTPITDAGLAQLAELTGLCTLCLTATRITDAGLVHLKALTNLQELELLRTEITDAGLANLRGLTGLQTLGLSLTKVSDAGLMHLRELTNLKWLDLMGTSVTEQGTQELKKAIPTLKILGVY